MKRETHSVLLWAHIFILISSHKNLLFGENGTKKATHYSIKQMLKAVVVVVGSDCGSKRLGVFALFKKAFVSVT